VNDVRTVCDSVRRPIQIAPDSFPVRMLRWAEVSPDGEAVVFQALGRLWIRELSGDEARPLTADNEHFEYFPSWSRDSRWIVYVAWDDDELGSVRVVPRAGAAAGVAPGAARTVSPRPGHFADPVFSPDGRTIVYRRTGSGSITSPLWSADTGIVRVDFGGEGSAPGEETRLTREGTNPHFGADPERVYYTSFGGPEERRLESVGLVDREVRTHLTSEAATELRVSPDGRWLAFAERFHAFVTPFPATGRKVTIGPKTKALPLARVSAGSADFLRWSGDSTRLHWTEGAELITRELASTFAFLEGAPDPLPDAPTAGLRLGFDAPSAVPLGRFLLEHGRLITLNGDLVIEDGAIAIVANRIVQLGGSGQVAAPEGAEVIDLGGRTVLPGLIDVHAHGPQGAGGIQPQQNWLHMATLSFGVTTIHDPSNDTQEVFAASELARAGRILAPRITSTGTILYGAAGDFKAEIESLEDARFHVGRLRKVGAFSVKSYNQPRRDQRQMVLAAARELDMEVMPEGGSLFQHNMTQVVDGHTTIEHSIPVGTIYEDVVQLWSGTRVAYTPTLCVAYGGIWGENYWYQNTRVFENERLQRWVPRDILDRRSVRNSLAAPEGEWNHIRAARVAATLFESGVDVNVGGHGQREGLGAHWEMWMLVQGGLTPHQALRCGTLHGARTLGAEADLGSLETGKLADLIVLDADPLEDIRNSEKIDLVMINGWLLDARTLQPREDSGAPAGARSVSPAAGVWRPLWFQRDE
jgi:imidazolonepropionase-like amidohydrolase